MPNYKLSASLKEHIKRQAEAFCARRIANAETGFPLTAEEIQYGLLDPEDVRVMAKLKLKGVHMPEETKPPFIIAGVPGLSRTVGVIADLPEEVFIPGNPGYFYGGKLTRYDYDRNPRFNVTRLPPEKLAALVSWCNAVVRERRLAKMTQWLVKTMLYEHLPTSGHLLTRWPVLAMLVEDKVWKSRLQNSPGRTSLYRWRDDSAPAELAKFMTAADVVLTSAALLPKPERNNSVVGAVVASWEALPNDREFA